MAFNAETTAEEVVAGLDLSGKTIVVTGSSAGLGAETARVLAKAGAEVVLVARNAEKNAKVIAAIQAETPAAKLSSVTMDLGDLVSVRKAAQEILAAHPKVHALINNAGFVGGPRILTAEGQELHFAANHIGPFLFTNLLYPALKAAAPSRVIVLSSNGHRMPGFDFDDLDFSKRAQEYNHWTAYSQSKRANVLHAVGLAKRLAGTGVTANAVHPGVIRTEVFRDVAAIEEQMVTGWAEANGSPLKSIPQGASTQVWGAVSPEAEGISGVYLEDTGIAKHIPSDVVSAVGVIEEALDPKAADRLWAISEKVVGETFVFA
jgi:NAD(P)-dependent dehydrogenase (short-subunit alcohol dehydrogenase family)